MAAFKDLRRRFLLPLGGLALGLFYLLGFMPLAHEADSLDAPVNAAWRKLAVALGQTNTLAIDFSHITNQLNETRQALTILEDTKKKAASRFEVSAELRAHLNDPFQLVDFQNERSKKMDDLDRLAREQKITIDPAVFAGFPEHTVEIRDPSLLWAALALSDELLSTAITCKVTAIHSLEVNMDLTNALPFEAARRWTQIPIQVEFTASGDTAVKLIQSLPLRADEIRAAGLPEPPADKPPLLVDRLVVRKESPEKLNEVRVWLQATAFVLRE